MTLSEKSKEVLRALSKLSATSSLSINELRVVLALERVVARIDAHKILREKLTFKGGFVLLKTLDSDRFTRDLDALAGNMPREQIGTLVKEALSVDLDDGLHFADPEIEDLIDQGSYGGYRLKIPFQIGPLPTYAGALKKHSRVHLDIGFGDVISGKAKRAELPPLIEGEKPILWKVYPMRSIYAEKLETLVSRGSANSRTKDLYDLVVIFDELKGKVALASAIRKTFKNRKTALPDSFADLIAQLDFTILERSWGSVELSGGKMTFTTCKRRLKRVLNEVDALMRTKKKR